jgi:hypothetical protein
LIYQGKSSSNFPTVAEVKWRILPKLLVSLGIDAVVLDDCDFYGATIPIHLGMPYAILSNAIHFDYSGYTPFCYYDYAHESTPEGIRRNRQGVAKFIQMLVRSHANVIAQVKKTGINGDWENPSSLYSGYPWITQCPREFDFESSHWPRHFHYAGPFQHRCRARNALRIVLRTADTVQKISKRKKMPSSAFFPFRERNPIRRASRHGTWIINPRTLLSL